VQRVDWDSLQIVETHDDEGRVALVSEKQMCEILGFEVDHVHVDEGQMNEQGVDNEQCVDNEQGVDTEGVTIPTSDHYYTNSFAQCLVKCLGGGQTFQLPWLIPRLIEMVIFY
jgi:hypothetical protein